MAEDSAQRRQSGPSGLDTRGRLLFVFRDSLLYGGASVFKTSFALLTFPILTHHFSVAEYGVIDLFGLMTSFFVIFCRFGQDSAIVRFFYDSEERAHRQQVISQSLAFQFFIVALLLPLPLLFSERIGASFSDSPHAGMLVRLILITVPFEIVFSVSSAVCKFNFERAKYLFLTVGITLVRVLVLVWAIYVLDIGVVGVFVVNLSLSIAGCCVGAYFIRMWIRRPTSFRLTKKMLPYAIPFGVVCSLTVFFPILQRLFVEEMIGPDSLGLYSAGAKVALLIALPISAFQTAWGPFSLAVSRGTDVDRTYRIVLRCFVLLAAPCILFLDGFSRLILGILAGDQYTTGSEVVFPLACGLCATAIGLIAGLGLTIEKKEFYRLYAYMVYFAVSFGAMWFLGSLFGMVGIAFGALVGQLVLAATLTRFSCRVSSIDWNLQPVILYVMIFFAAGLIQYFALPLLIGTFYTALVTPISAVMVAAVGWWAMFDAQDRTASIKIVRDGFKKLRPS